ncbi:MAG: hypothetical protein MPK75_03040 [Alphaproteobacteria bacterium]|nr:hypothetical protein [Alphaproteobacteria bacterium]
MSKSPSTDNVGTNTEWNIHPSVIGFIENFKIPESNIKKHFEIIGPNKIVRNYKIQNSTLAKSQIDLACMLALENALRNGSFEFSFEEVKAACRSNNCFNSSNFRQNFKSKSKLFKSFTNENNVVLTSDGKKYLADLLTALSKES